MRNDRTCSQRVVASLLRGIRQRPVSWCSLCCCCWPRCPCLELVSDPNWLLAYLSAYVTPSDSQLAISDPHPGSRRASLWGAPFHHQLRANLGSLSRPHSIRTGLRPSPCAPSAIVSQRHLQTALEKSHRARQAIIRIAIRNSKAKSPSREQQQPRWETRATISTRRW